MKLKLFSGLLISAAALASGPVFAIGGLPLVGGLAAKPAAPAAATPAPKKVKKAKKAKAAPAASSNGAAQNVAGGGIGGAVLPAAPGSATK